MNLLGYDTIPAHQTTNVAGYVPNQKNTVQILWIMTLARNIRPLTLRPTSLWQKTTIQIFTVVKQRVFWIRSQFGNGYSAKRWVRKTVNFAEGTKKTYRRRQTDRQTLNICRKSRTTWSVLEWKESEVSGIWFQRRIKSKFIWSVWRSKLLILQFVGVNILAILF